MPYGPETYDGRDRNFLKGLTGLASEVGTGTCSSNAVTINDYFGLITTESLTTAQNGVVTITVTNDKVVVGDLVFVSVGDGTNTQGTPVVTRVNVSASTIAISISNLHASAQALNGTLRIRFAVVKALA